MGWRSVVISQPAYLSLENSQLSIEQDSGDKALVSVEDISVLILDCANLTISLPLLCQLADAGVAVLTVSDQHLPNGIFLPYQSHYAGLGRLRAQLALSKPKAKRWQQQIIRQKILNQRAALQALNCVEPANALQRMAARIRSGDPDNYEAQAAALYFRHIFYTHLIRGQSRFYNAALNYGYAVIRAAIARSIAGAGLQPALGIFHNNERNAFNLADDLIEPYRPLLDLWVARHFPQEPDRDLQPADKGILVSFLHQDIGNNQNNDLCTVLVHTGQAVQSFASACLNSCENSLWLVTPPPALFALELTGE